MDENMIQGGSSSVSVESIPNELSRLWSEAGGPGGESVIRVCVMNLLVYVTSQEEMEKVMQAFPEVIQEHPARVILLIPHEGEDSGIKARVTSHCRLHEGHTREICCEQIVLEASGKSRMALPATAMQQISPDLPVILWWAGNLDLKDPVFSKLSQSADLVILDSSQLTNWKEILPQIAELQNSDSRGPVFHDLNWGRLLFWREKIAAFFDTEDCLPYLDTLDHIEIRYQSDPSANPLQALFLIGWLSARLKWDLKSFSSQDNSSEEWMAVFQKKLHLIQVVIQKVYSKDIFPGDLISVLLESHTPNPAQFQIQCGENKIYARVCHSLGGKDSSSQICSREIQSLGGLIQGELEIMGRDPLYEEAFREASHMIQIGGMVL